uniref:Uncharacterized protein n=1 Tax=Avena sativa TaxID=4498 RepID=A0ACD5XH20_AVESA
MYALTPLILAKELERPSLTRQGCKKSKMGEKGCGRCSRWQEHYYWEHMDVDKIRFFKLMTADFQQRMRIPDKFASNFMRQMQTAEGLGLKAPSGETWRVGVTNVTSELFLEAGWGDFAKAHELQENDLLLFTCSGRSSFEVLIFDSSGCEKLSPLFAGGKCKHFDDMVMGQQIEQYSVTVDDESDDDDDDDTNAPAQLVGSPHNVSNSKKHSAKTKASKDLTEVESDHARCTNPDYYYSRAASQLTDDEIREVNGLASTRPGNPAFLKVLQRTHLQCRNNFLIIPYKFSADHLQRRPHDVLLFRPSREEQWGVRYYHGSSKRGFNCRRWVRFVRDNGLREDDVCVFELIKGAKTKDKTARPTETMAVHVARRKKDGRFVTVG